jgi:hypothetical protein
MASVSKSQLTKVQQDEAISNAEEDEIRQVFIDLKLGSYLEGRIAGSGPIELPHFLWWKSSWPMRLLQDEISSGG